MNLTNEQKIKILETYQMRPNLFLKEVLGAKLYGLQEKIVDTISGSKITAIRSCHASGKTWLIARVVLQYLYCHPYSQVVTTAPTFRQVEEVLWREVRSAHYGARINLGGQLLKTRLDVGGEEKWFAIGLSTDTPEQFAGFHAPHMLILVDEASGVPVEIFEAIQGLMAGGDCKLVMIGNPTRIGGYFYDSFSRPSVAKLHISAFDVVAATKNERIPGLVTEQWINEMRTQYGEDSDVWRVRVLGEFPKTDVQAIMGVDDIEKAMQRNLSIEVKMDGEYDSNIHMGVDVARFGDDTSRILTRSGFSVLKVKKLQKTDLMTLVGEVIANIKEFKVNPQNVRVDVIGVGAGVVDRLQEQGYNVCGVNVAEKAIESDKYVNLRAEGFMSLKAIMNNIRLTNDEGFYQLANIKYKYNSRGQLVIESKEDMKRRGLSSPDVADALMLSFIPNMSNVGLTVF